MSSINTTFILYGDGSLIIERFDDEIGRYKYFYRMLSQPEVCRLLNTIDQLGFLDFNPETYSVEGIYDASTWNIKVKTWRVKEISFLYALGELISDLKHFGEFPINSKIPRSVLDTFILLSTYPLDGFSEYTEPLGIWVWKPSDDNESKIWTLPDLSLAELYQQAGSPVNALPNPIIMNGKIAEDIYAMFNNSVYYGSIIEGDNNYQIYVRPILPFEQIIDGTSIITPSSTQLDLPDNLRCAPSNGIMTVPTFELK
jgi:hypothetical protein